MIATADLGRRVGVGVVLATVAIAALWLGGVALWALASLVALIGLAEWGALVGAGRLRTAVALAVLAAALICALPMLWDTDRSSVAALLITALLLALVPGAAGVAFGAGYVGTAAIGLMFLREQPHGVLLALWTLAIVWATDIGAFFAGRAIGGARLAPAISPNKTWAGLAGGVVAATLVGWIVARVGNLPPATLMLGAPLAVLAQVGDLFESWLKRRRGLKDSGRLLPGHGGVLDRIDGMLPVTILVAALVANGSL